ncbi:GNAT family N-acetyltransferase [Nocardioides cavernaquae]|uniref:GNAT family N-acetyltransferase n=2 Tax=Nocardioides cavernaquae TaxID=2321396 RepID=A0A3A5HBE8_9ACTN|nr:GNAT family N-acetyltransferase [Nocardioides cavernaquae]
MHATSPPESVHPLDLDGLRDAAVTFYAAWLDDVLMGCGALKELGDGHAEIKSMRTSSHARGRGVGGELLLFLLAEAGRRGIRRVSLETGVEPYFAPARRMYARHGFTECPPFGSYRVDPNSVFMTRTL